MKKFLILLLSLILTSGNLDARSNDFDIYGVDPELQKQIISTCKKEIAEYDRLSQELGLTMKLNKQMIKRHEIELSIIKKVRTLGNFSIISFSPINYPHKNGIITYSTLDIVQKNDTNRLPKSAARETKELAKLPDLEKLFQIWGAYNNRVLALMMQNKLDMKTRTCPVIHCAWGFDKEEMENDVPKLIAGASKYKNQLNDIIKYGNNKRGEAVFILANTHEYKELAELMISLINDSDETVRNNSLRVLGAIVEKHKIHNLDIHNILLALNYPYVTDRNKAAYILWNMVRKDKLLHPLVINESGTTLINLLKLKQPNNHDVAYLILKEISHKNYAERDYQHWQQWLDSEKSKLNQA